MKLHTIVKGRGTPIIFLHTGLQTGMSDFEYQRDHFSRHYQVVLPDLRGHGNSFTEDFSHYFSDSATDLRETLEGLGITSTHIVGCSLGALAGISFANQFPERVKSMTVSGILPKKPVQWKRMHAKEVNQQRQLLRDEEQVRYFNLLHNTNWRDFIYLARNENWYPFDLTDRLPKIPVPILYMVGEQNMNEVEGAVLYANHEHIRVAVLPFAGHTVHTDQQEWYTEVLEKFLDQIEKGTEV